jgi:hypothetical protein
MYARKIAPLGLGAMPVLAPMQPPQRPMTHGAIPTIQPQQQQGLLDSMKLALGLLSNEAFMEMVRRQWITNEPMPNLNAIGPGGLLGGGL